MNANYKNEILNSIYNKIIMAIENSPDSWDGIEFYGMDKDIIKDLDHYSPKEARGDFFECVLNNENGMENMLMDYPDLLNVFLSDDFGACILTYIALNGNKTHINTLREFGIEMDTAVWHSNRQNVADVYSLDPKFTMGGLACYLGDMNRIEQLIKWDELNFNDVGLLGGVNKEKLTNLEVGIILGHDVKCSLFFIDCHLDMIQQSFLKKQKFEIDSNVLTMLCRQKEYLIKNNKNAKSCEDYKTLNCKIDHLFYGYLDIYSDGDIKKAWDEIIANPDYGLYGFCGDGYKSFYQIIGEKLKDDEFKYRDENIKLINNLIPNFQELWSIIITQMPNAIQKKYIRENLGPIYENIKKKPKNYRYIFDESGAGSFDTWMSIESMIKNHMPEIYERVIKLNSSEHISNWWKNKDKLEMIFTFKDNIKNSPIKIKKM